MILRSELATASRHYLRAASFLNRKSSSSPDASAYLCGYAVEIALKASICRTLGWAGYLETGGEFRDYSSFKTHNLEVLLHLSGAEALVKSNTAVLTAWSVVQGWNPEQRYKPVGTRTVWEVRDMIDATRRLLGVLL